MPIIKVVLTNDEKIALIELSRRELRDPRSQLLVLLRRELELNGFLPAPNTRLVQDDCEIDLPEKERPCNDVD